MEAEIAKDAVSALNRCEKIIETGLHTFWEVGMALTEVRDKQLWSGRYASFNEYLAGRWKMKPLYAGQLMLASEIRTELVRSNAEQPEEKRFQLPDSIGGACALRALDKEEKIQVLETLRERQLPPTQKNIRTLVETIYPPLERPPKLSYRVLRGSLDALVKQTEFLDEIPPERWASLFDSADEREAAVEALTRLIGVLSAE